MLFSTEVLNIAWIQITACTHHSKKDFFFLWRHILLYFWIITASIFFFFTFLRVLQPSKTGFYHLWSLVHFLFWLFFTLETILEYNTAASALLYHSLCSKMLAQATLWMDAGKSPYESQQCTKMILINTRIQYVSASLFKC